MSQVESLCPAASHPQPESREGQDLSRDEIEQLHRAAYRLRFPWRLEAEFHHIYSTVAVRYPCLLVTVFVVGYSLFGVSDLWGFPYSRVEIHLLRYGVTLPILVGLASLAWIGSRRWLRSIIVAIYLTGGLSIVGFEYLADPRDPGYSQTFAGLVFPILMAQVSRLGVRRATAVGAALCLANSIVTLGRLTRSDMSRLNLDLTPPHSLGSEIGNLFYLGFILMTGIVVGYVLEVSARKDFVRQRELAQERARSESLLANLLPEAIAQTLKDNAQTNSAPKIAQEHPSASILFADLVNFTSLAEQLPASDLVSLLDEIFSEYDELVEDLNLEKIKTIGDCYMVAAGVPTSRPDHAEAIAHLALRMLDRTQQFAQRSGHPLNVRIGIHSGLVVAGVIGRKKLMYDLWGDTVNTASRFESHGIPGIIQISAATHHLLQGRFHCIPQGTVWMKGKGDMPVWHLLSHNSPTPPKTPPQKTPPSSSLPAQKANLHRDERASNKYKITSQNHPIRESVGDEGWLRR